MWIWGFRSEKGYKNKTIYCNKSWEHGAKNNSSRESREKGLGKTGEQEPDVHSGWAPEIISGDGTTIRCGHMEASPQTRHIRESPLLPCSSLISSEPWLQVRLSVSSVVCSWSSSFSSCCLMLSAARLFSCSSRFMLSSWLMDFTISVWLFLKRTTVSDSARRRSLDSLSCEDKVVWDGVS